MAGSYQPKPRPSNDRQACGEPMRTGQGPPTGTEPLQPGRIVLALKSGINCVSPGLLRAELTLGHQLSLPRQTIKPCKGHPTNLRTGVRSAPGG